MPRKKVNVGCEVTAQTLHCLINLKCGIFVAKILTCIPRQISVRGQNARYETLHPQFLLFAPCTARVFNLVIYPQFEVYFQPTRTGNSCWTPPFCPNRLIFDKTDFDVKTIGEEQNLFPSIWMLLIDASESQLITPQKARSLQRLAIPKNLVNSELFEWLVTRFDCSTSTSGQGRG